MTSSVKSIKLAAILATTIIGIGSFAPSVFAKGIEDADVHYLDSDSYANLLGEDPATRPSTPSAPAANAPAASSTKPAPQQPAAQATTPSATQSQTQSTPTYNEPVSTQSVAPTYNAPVSTNNTSTVKSTSQATNTTNASSTGSVKPSVSKPAELPKNVAKVVNKKASEIAKSADQTNKTLDDSIKALSSSKTKTAAQTKINEIVKDSSNKAKLAVSAISNNASTSAQKASATQQILSSVHVAKIINSTKATSNNNKKDSQEIFVYAAQAAQAVINSANNNNLKDGSDDYIQFTNAVRMAVNVNDTDVIGNGIETSQKQASETLTKAKTINDTLTKDTIKSERKALGEAIKADKPNKVNQASLVNVKPKHNRATLIIASVVSVVIALFVGLFTSKKLH